MNSATLILSRPLLLAIALALAGAGSRGSLAAQADAPTGPSALGLRIVRDAGTVDTTCALVQREQRGNDVVLSFVTAAHLFRKPDGTAFPPTRKIEVVIPPSVGSGGVASAEGMTILVDPKDVDLPTGNGATVATLRAVVPLAKLSPTARSWMEQHAPDQPTRAGAPPFVVSPRQFAGPTILAACGENKTGDIDVPFTLNAGEAAIDASAALMNRKALRLADAKVLTLTNEIVKVRFTLGGEPPPQPPAPCLPGQALLTVHLTVVKTPR